MQPGALPTELLRILRLSNESALVMLSAEVESPAGRAGVTLGDVLVTLEGVPIGDTDDVQSVLSGSQIGQTIRASILRGGELREITLTLAERPKETVSDYDEPRHIWNRSRWRR